MDPIRRRHNPDAVDNDDESVVAEDADDLRCCSHLMLSPLLSLRLLHSAQKMLGPCGLNSGLNAAGCCCSDEGDDGSGGIRGADIMGS